jgi:Tfp pilus assembly protein PilF
MNRYFLLLLLLIPIFVFAQKKYTQKEIDQLRKQSKEIQKQAAAQLEELKKTDPETAKMVEQMMKQASGTSRAADVEEAGQFSYATTAPEKDLARLKSIPEKTLDNNQLKNFVQAMNTSLLGTLTAQEKRQFESALAEIGNSASQLQDAAIVNWLRKSPKGALLFAMKAVETNTEDPMLQNNLGALLIQCKREEKAIPILLSLLEAYPKSSIVLNNLGQAYLGLGDIAKAKEYLDQCLQLVPTHPEANHSMALIARFAGNNAAADAYFQKELAVKFRKAVYERLKSKNTHGLSDAIRARWMHPPNYFTELGMAQFRVPDLPRSLAESNRLYLAHQQFQKRMRTEIQKLAEADAAMLKTTMGKTGKQKSIHADLVAALLENFEEVKDKQLSWINLSEDGVTEYPSRGNPSTKQWRDMTLSYAQEAGRLNTAQRTEDSLAGEAYRKEAIKYLEAPDWLRQKWAKEQKDIQIKYCRLQIALADSWLPKFAEYHKNGFQEHANVFPDLINETYYYSSLAPDDPAPLFVAHNVVMSYLSFLEAYSALTVIASTPQNNFQGQGDIYVGCDIDKLLSEQITLGAVNDAAPKCAFKITVPLVVAKASFDCNGAEVEGGEGLIVGAAYEFKSGNTTLSIGAGIETNIPFVSAGAKQQVYVTFDSNGNYSDAGVKGEAGAEIGGFGPTVSSKAGYQVGINAGASAAIEGAGVSTPIRF